MFPEIQTKTDIDFDPIQWFLANVEFQESNSAEFWYDRMESQSGKSLPVVYLPFGGRCPGHFADRGHILDFAANVGPGRVLDFGPGDGWPSLSLAPMVDETIGVDGSKRRVEICIRNAYRLGCKNAQFIHVPPGQSLPFEDEFFDGITASSSIEQTPDPKATLRELFRVLKPGRRLRMGYESLSFYHGGREREICLGWQDGTPSSLLIFDRDLERESVRHYAFLLDMPRREARRILAPDGGRPKYETLTPETLEALTPKVVETATWTTRHPSCCTWISWMRELGFTSAKPTYDGGTFARSLFDKLPESLIPREMDEVDQILRPLISVITELDAPCKARPGQWEPKITAVR